MSAAIAKGSTPIGRGAMSVSEGGRYCGINEYFLYRLIKNGGGPRVVRLVSRPVSKWH